jgi:hypothetical protein
MEGLSKERKKKKHTTKLVERQIATMYVLSNPKCQYTKKKKKKKKKKKRHLIDSTKQNVYYFYCN